MNESTQWPTPTPLRPDGTNLLKFPIDALPQALKEMVLAISVTTSTDVGMAGTAMLSAVGYCFSGMYRLAGKPDHTEPPVLYSLIIAQPSERKSPVMHFIKAPFDSFESKYNNDHKQQMYKAQQDVKAIEAKIRAMEKEEDPDTEQISKLRIQMEGIRNTTPVCIAVDDITPESLTMKLAENQTMLMISDEAGMLNNFNGKYSGGIPNLDMLLKAWNGERYISDRVIRGRSEISRPYLSVTLAGQPYIWDNMVSNSNFRSSGLLARFILCYASSSIGSRKYDTASIPYEVKTAYHRLIHQFLEGKFQHDGNEAILKLSASASEVYISFCNSYIEKELVGGMTGCQDWGGKMHGLILRIALILHCVNCCSEGIQPDAVPVNDTEIANANALAVYYQEQAKYCFGIHTPDNVIALAERVLRVLKTNDIRQETKSELYRRCRWKEFKNMKDFDNVLHALAEYGYIQIQNVQTANHKPAQMVYVNPRI